jgi:hypothetical protein
MVTADNSGFPTAICFSLTILTESALSPRRTKLEMQVKRGRFEGPRGNYRYILRNAQSCKRKIHRSAAASEWRN